MRLGDHVSAQLDCIPSGCLTLDLALGGGWARGRVVEVYGPEASGKTTLALHAGQHLTSGLLVLHLQLACATWQCRHAICACQCAWVCLGDVHLHGANVL